MQPANMAYDRAITVFSPDGRLFQVEYAREAVKRGTTTVGLKYKTGVVLIVDKRVTSRLIEPNSIEKIFEIDEYRARYEHYLKEFITPANKLFVYSECEKKFNMLYELYSPYLDNVMDEGEEMVNDERTREYFLKKTQSIIEQLGLNEQDYELPA